jgi:hypothetical protein
MTVAADLDSVRAYGPRLAYDALPERARLWVSEALGGEVVDATTCCGGFSPGVAARVRATNGRRAFVKAVGASLNPDSPTMQRNEIAVLSALPRDPVRADLLNWYDDGAWVALLLEDIDGHCPTLPWRQADLDRVVAALVDLARTHTPNPWADAPPIGDRLGPMFGGWAQLAENGAADLAPWQQRRLSELVELSEWAATAADGISCVHLDTRSDNILLSDDRVVLVDWNWCVSGAPWFDTLCLALEVCATGGDPEALLAASPLTRSLDPMVITGVMAGLAGMFERRRREPPPVGLPRIRTFQAGYAAALGGWLRARTGWQ